MSADDSSSSDDAAADATRTSSPSAAPVDHGDVVGPDAIGARRPRDRYHIIGEHGRGGLGRVSRAHDRELDRDVAIKELISRAPLSEVRFLREALITARLEHPNIVPVHEAGRWPDGTPFYAMKLVAGRSLRELIAERHTVAERIALLHHVIAVADAMAYAHGRQIIHRDLKPGNVIVGDFGETIVIDWGLAKDLSASEDSISAAAPADRSLSPSSSVSIDLTMTGSVLGTPAYMAPEQERGEHVDQRADVFAIGAMLWELCALDKVPPSNIRQRHRILRHTGIDGDLITIIDKSLDPDPARRYPDAGALAADLKAFKSGARIAARSYSLPAMLAHWTRRHRGLALSVIALAVVAALGIVLYVRNISVERDRANTQTIEANHQRADATAARDRAQLSEINTLLEKDPTRALELLQKVTDRTPQYALLMSRATQRAATKVIKLKDRLRVMRRAPDRAEVALMTEGDELFTMPIAAVEPHLVDAHATGSLTYGDNAWWYTRRIFGKSTQVTNDRTGAPVIDAPDLDSRNASDLLFRDHHLYEYDNAGDVYRIDPGRTTITDHNLRTIIANDRLTLICDRGHKFTVIRDRAKVFESTCAASSTSLPFAVADDHYAVARDPSTLLVDGRALAIPTPLSTSHEIAITTAGLVTVADYQGNAWFVRPGSNEVEMVPRRAMSPLSTTAAGSIAAWGYQDGSIVALDVATQETWELIGHNDAVAFLALDAQQHRVITASWHEVRIWDLPSNPVTVAARMPCSASQIVKTGSASDFALNCTDGGIRVWSARSNQIAIAHRHAQYPEGLALYHGALCSAGWEGDVICSGLDGSNPRTVFTGHGRIYGLLPCPDGACLLASTSDGEVWRIDDRVHSLFRHTDVPSVMTTSPDGRWLASAAEDGSLVLYDLATNQTQERHPHVGRINDAAWNGESLWTAGKDGHVKRWQLAASEPVMQDAYSGPSPVTFLTSLQTGLALSVSPQYLSLLTTPAAAVTTLDVDKPIRAIQESADHRYLAAVTFEELVVIDLQMRAVAVARPASRSLQCLHFMQDSTVALCGRGSILTVDLAKLTYVHYLSSLPNQNAR